MRARDRVDAAAYLDALGDAFHRAGQLCGIEARHLDFAGYPVRVECAGSELAAKILPAFEHIAGSSPTADPVLTVRAWDRASAGEAPPPPPWKLDNTVQHRVEIDPSVLRANYDAGFGLLSRRQPQSSQALFYGSSPAGMPRWVQRMPFRHILGWWAEETGLSFVHAACVGRDGACVLLPG
ncbi:MAG TPA: hypothetical protein PLV68_15850, partial [Ilumatobacteraceae bacterium]|nr:hypothetical protein [Ilumatobacteraceae bacterium]